MKKNNTGDLNTGDLNTGNSNTGNRNSGSWNTGDRNTGNWNSGSWNTGDWNSGSWNTGDWNSGNLNTNEPPLRIFNKETNIKRSEINYPDFFWWNLTKWVYENEMSDKEKEAYPTYITNGGYLKIKTYKGAWRESWDKASEEDKRKCFDLPNWNNELFKEISGIDVEKELNENEEVNIKISKKYLEALKEAGVKIIE